jgi:hypothetical protein
MRDEFDLDEFDDLDDDEDDTSNVSMPCPHCFGTIYDDSERCPHCGMYLSSVDRPLRPPWWIVMGVCIALLIVARWIVGF